ncbi:cation:proton antiporter [Magnetovibrio sp. PR-2]|uniref:cation:proton antiporter n=1 Tax=Magnetovibrio sp. PR-2 TaxID=3120356 RepID=UPI002FCE1D07
MELFYVLLVLLVVTRTFGIAVERLGQPALIGELVAGIALGVIGAAMAPSHPFIGDLRHNDIFIALTNLGMFFLMLLAGIEMQPHKIMKYSITAFLVALGGLVLPLALGFGLGWMFLPEGPLKIAQSFFLGTALAITAVPASVRVLMDLGKLNTPVGQVIVTAAVFDDVLSLLLLAFLTGMVSGNGASTPQEMMGLGLDIISFFAITILLGIYGFPKGAVLLKHIREKELDFSLILIAAFAFAVLAELMGLHFILGPFVAGMFVGRRVLDKSTYMAVKSKISATTLGFLAPVFFASVGLNLEVSAFTEVPVFLALLIVAAFVGKIVGAGAMARLRRRFDNRESLAVGVGMSARGAVELVIADIALKAGLFTTAVGANASDPVVANIFSAVVVMAIVTTVVTSVSLRFILTATHGGEEDEGDEWDDEKKLDESP